MAAAYIAKHQMPTNKQLQSQTSKTQAKHRLRLVQQIKGLRYLLCQGMAIRNDHAGGSNLTVMLQQVLDEGSWVSENKYQSPEVINELIEIMAHIALRSLLHDVMSQKWFALLADEAKDTSNKEQLVLCLRYVSDSYEVFEDIVYTTLKWNSHF